MNLNLEHQGDHSGVDFVDVMTETFQSSHIDADLSLCMENGSLCALSILC